ncbi:MAG: ABC transporter permease [Symbiobacteriaceae bacterium]|nr:ABC transporter permease [Symbiobacteriaceae bacterium]
MTNINETSIPEFEGMFDPLNTEALKDDVFQTSPMGFFKESFLRFTRYRVSIVAFWIIMVVVFLAAFGPALNPYGFNDQNVARMNMPPRIPYLEKMGIADGSRILTNRRASGLSDLTVYPPGSIMEIMNPRMISGVEMVDLKVNYYSFIGLGDEYFWFGTDYLGRDLFTRLFRGTRISLIIAIFSVAINTVIGVIYGAIAGYYGGNVDMLLMRLVEIISGIPQLVVFTLFILVFGRGINAIIFSFVVTGWMPTAYLIRAQFYRFKGREYVLAARTLGVPDRLLVFRHILPNCVGPLITRAMIAIPGAIFSESFLAYIGLGLQPPEPSIGVMLSDGQRVLLQFPYQTLFPAIIISALMISFNLFSNGLRDALDPTKRGEF